MNRSVGSTKDLHEGVHETRKVEAGEDFFGKDRRYDATLVRLIFRNDGKRERREEKQGSWAEEEETRERRTKAAVVVSGFGVWVICIMRRLDSASRL